MGTTVCGGRRAGICAVAALGMASLWSVGAEGAATPSPALTLLHESMTALGHAPRVVLSGYVQAGARRIGLLVRSADHGRDASLHVRVGPEAFSFVRVGTSCYLDATESIWSARAAQTAVPATVLKTLAGRWVRLPESEANAVISSFWTVASPAKLASNALRGFVGMGTGMHLGPMTQVDGIAARSIVAADGRIDVAAKGAPLPLKLVGPRGSSAVFTLAYPKGLQVTAPVGAITVAQAVAAAQTQQAPPSPLRYRASYAHFSADFPAPPQEKTFPASFASYHMRIYAAIVPHSVEVVEEDITPALPSAQARPLLATALRTFAASGLSMTSPPAATTYRSYAADRAVYSGGGLTLIVMDFMTSSARVYLLVAPENSFSALEASFTVTP